MTCLTWVDGYFRITFIVTVYKCAARGVQEMNIPSKVYHALNSYLHRKLLDPVLRPSVQMYHSYLQSLVKRPALPLLVYDKASKTLKSHPPIFSSSPGAGARSIGPTAGPNLRGRGAEPARVSCRIEELIIHSPFANHTRNRLRLSGVDN